MRLSVRGSTNVVTGDVTIYKSAFHCPISDKFDATSVISTVTHEGFHARYVPAQTLMGMSGDWMEYSAYSYSYMRGFDQNLSNGTMRYLGNKMVENLW